MTYPGSYDLKFSQGETVRRTFTWAISGTAVDLTGYSARLQMRERVTSPDILLELTSPAAGITLGGADGAISISIDATVTATLPARSVVYSLELTSAGGEVTPLLSGSVEIRAEVTR